MMKRGGLNGRSSSASGHFRMSLLFKLKSALPLEADIILCPSIPEGGPARPPLRCAPTWSI